MSAPLTRLGEAGIELLKALVLGLELRRADSGWVVLGPWQKPTVIDSRVVSE